jgi:hypothetical protein
MPSLFTSLIFMSAVVVIHKEQGTAERCGQIMKLFVQKTQK